MRNLCRLGAPVLMLSLPLFAGLTSHSELPCNPGLPPQTANPESYVAADASATGGSVFICIASGILFGASVLTGNGLGAAGAVVAAIENGCL